MVEGALAKGADMTATQGPKGRSGRESPSDSPIVPSAGPPSYEPSHVIQSLIEIQKELSALSAKTDRVIDDVKLLNSHVDDLRKKLNWAEGFAVAAAVLIPACATLIWWLIGNQLTDIKNKIYSPPSQASYLPDATVPIGHRPNRLGTTPR